MLGYCLLDYFVAFPKGQINKLDVRLLGRGTAWLDTGTFQSLMQANQYIQVIEERQGRKIGCIKKGYLADGVFIKKNNLDLDPLQNSHASIVHRANENSIKAVMIGGKIVHGKL